VEHTVSFKNFQPGVTVPPTPTFFFGLTDQWLAAAPSGDIQEFESVASPSENAAYLLQPFLHTGIYLRAKLFEIVFAPAKLAGKVSERHHVSARLCVAIHLGMKLTLYDECDLCPVVDVNRVSALVMRISGQGLRRFGKVVGYGRTEKPYKKKLVVLQFWKR
jgi:hypothetical protein